MKLLTGAHRLLRGDDFPASCRPTYVRHFASTILDAISAGILLNVPLMALKGMKSPPWQMAIQLVISGFGMIAVLWMGDFMSTRRKMRFVTVPALCGLACTTGMIFSRSTLIFLLLSGFATLFETVSRPGVTAIIRSNYPATHRGAITGALRKWGTLISLAISLLSAWSLDWAASHSQGMIRGQLGLAVALSLAAILIYNSIRVTDDPAPSAQPEPMGIVKPFRNAVCIVAENGRFRRFMLIGFVYGFGGLSYVSFIPVLLDKQLHFGYFASSIYLNVLPSLLTALSTGIIGRWVDRVNQWKAWIWIRLGWGLDPILLTCAGAAAPFSIIAAHVLTTLGRTSRGLVAGGSWVIWWQIGVAHFAPPGADTSRYQGILMFMNGFARILGPSAGAWMLHSGSMTGVLLMGGGMVLLTSLLSAVEYARESKDERLATMARFENGFKKESGA